jgi:hypothetical protein
LLGTKIFGKEWQDMAQALKIGGEVQTKSWWVPLGNTGIVVPRLSIGTGTYGWGGSSAQKRLGF